MQSSNVRYLADQALSGQSVCEECEANSYSSSNAIECTQCPLKMVTHSWLTRAGHNISDCTCGVGTFGSMTSGCYPCVRGGYCPEGSTVPRSVLGYWQSADDPFTIMSCRPPEACLASINKETTTCAVGYTGFMCSECEMNYFRRAGECNQCSRLKFDQVALVMLASLFTLALLRMSKPSPVPLTA
jgi:hypothetical protein